MAQDIESQLKEPQEVVDDSLKRAQDIHSQMEEIESSYTAIMRDMAFELALMKQHKTSFLADKYNELITMATETVRVLSNHSSL